MKKLIINQHKVLILHTIVKSQSGFPVQNVKISFQIHGKHILNAGGSMIEVVGENYKEQLISVNKIKFEKSLDKDLERRDFTVNAMALELISKSNKAEKNYKIVDLFEISDLSAS